MKYKKEVAGSWVRPVRKDYKLACCDCGLVHTINFRLIKQGKKTFIEYQPFRDERATGQKRRFMKKPVKRPKPKY